MAQNWKSTLDTPAQNQANLKGKGQIQTPKHACVCVFSHVVRQLEPMVMLKVEGLVACCR